VWKREWLKENEDVVDSNRSPVKYVDIGETLSGGLDEGKGEAMEMESSDVVADNWTSVSDVNPAKENL
jgi:hypothetical protein